MRRTLRRKSETDEPGCDGIRRGERVCENVTAISTTIATVLRGKIAGQPLRGYTAPAIAICSIKGVSVALEFDARSDLSVLWEFFE